jgi:predicted metalloprotease
VLKIKEVEDFKKQLSFSLKEKEIIERLDIPSDIFLPLIFSIKFGGDWSLKINSKKVMAIKEKITRFDEEKMVGYTLENVFLVNNPVIKNHVGEIYRLEKCGNKKEREIVKRPYKLTIDAEYTLKASLNPMTKKITLKKIEGPFEFTGSNAYGVSHEMEHLLGNEPSGESLFDFEYEING